MFGNKLGNQLQGNCQALTDLRFADDILLFALSLQQFLGILRSFVSCLRQVGLVLNASDTKLMTTQAQPPDRVWFHADIYIDVAHVSCLWMVTTQQILSFISMQLHVHSGRTNGFYATSMSHYHFGSNFARPS